MRAVINKGWEYIIKPFINERIKLILKRLRAVINGGGAIIGY